MKFRSFILAMLLAADVQAQVNVPSQPVSPSSSPTFVNETLTGKLTLPTTTGANVGVIYFGSDVWAHSFEVQPAGTTTGENLFVGRGAGNFSLSGTSILASWNAGFGFNALHALTIGLSNTAIGSSAGAALTEGNENTAVGSHALFSLTGTNAATDTGIRNVAVGAQAMREAIDNADNNVAIGTGALHDCSTCDDNVAIGTVSGYSNSGAWALTTGIENVFIGTNGGLCSATQHSHSIAIGDRACVDADDKTVIGSFTGGVPTTTSVTVYGLPTNAFLQQAPTAPAGITSTGGVMCGLGSVLQITPTVTGRVSIDLQGTTLNNLVGPPTGGTSVLLKWGTVASGVPTEGQTPLVGTSASNTATMQLLPVNARTAFHLKGTMQSLTRGTAYWVDCAWAAVSGGTSTMGQLFAVLNEF